MVCRNENFARLFLDLKVMECNGTGFDKMYEALLSQGRAAPQLIEGRDRIKVIIQRRILKREVIRFIAKADAQHQLNRRERIALAMLAQQDAMTSRELVRGLALTSLNALPAWIGRLEELGLIGRAGERAPSMRYFVGAGPMRDLQFTERTTPQYRTAPAYRADSRGHSPIPQLEDWRDPRADWCRDPSISPAVRNRSVGGSWTDHTGRAREGQALSIAIVSDQAALISMR